jgi:hypothetical protein
MQRPRVTIRQPMIAMAIFAAPAALILNRASDPWVTVRVVKETGHGLNDVRVAYNGGEARVARIEPGGGAALRIKVKPRGFAYKPRPDHEPGDLTINPLWSTPHREPRGMAGQTGLEAFRHHDLDSSARA